MHRLSAEIMIKEQLLSRDISDRGVLKAMATVPRHLFVPEDSRSQAYGDFPLPIGAGQTISQPYIVAFMTQKLCLQGDERVLEVGTGSGYQTAVLSLLASEVYTLEVVSSLSRRARRTLDDLGYHNIRYRTGDGFNGWPEEAPFDAVLVTAAYPDIPTPLVRQLKTGGLLLMPMGKAGAIQELVLVRRNPEDLSVRSLMDVRFVPLIHRTRK